MRPLRRLIGTIARKTLGSYTHSVTDEPVIALTFDDGPHPDFTPRLLDILERYHAKATFFMVGETAQKFPELVRLVAEKGHVIGGHSWDHPSFPLISGRERRRQMRACERALAPYGHRLFRPPYGEQVVASRLDALWLGYEVVCWSVDVGDWYESDASLMAGRLVEWIHPGAIVLFHETLHDQGKDTPGRGPKHYVDGWCDREAVLAAIEMMFERVSHRFKFITVPELLQHGVPYRKFWFQRTPAA